MPIGLIVEAFGLFHSEFEKLSSPLLFPPFADTMKSSLDDLLASYSAYVSSLFLVMSCACYICSAVISREVATFWPF